jgi:hypothetical protein
MAQENGHTPARRPITVTAVTTRGSRTRAPSAVRADRCASVQPPELVVPLSRLRDVPESYSIFELKLVPLEGRASLTVTTVTWFPTEEIFKHLDFLLARHTPPPRAARSRGSESRPRGGGRSCCFWCRGSERGGPDAGRCERERARHRRAGVAARGRSGWRSVCGGAAGGAHPRQW